MRAASVFLAMLAVPIFPAPAPAAPVTWPVNGHQYEAFHAPAGLTWQAAYDSCLARGGYLATLTSAEEHAFVYGLVSGRPELWYLDGFGNGIGPWLGGMQPVGATEPGGGWRWVNGEPWSYTGWSPGEPNNAGTQNEDRLAFFRLGGLIGDRWNDMPQGVAARGWILEIPGAAPECATWSGNGHHYQIVRTPGRVTWEAANAGALARGGHLATITSSAENDFIAALASADPTLWQIDGAGNGQGPWIGGLQAPGSAEPAGGWGWVTGEPFVYTNWAPAEPNNLNGVEHHLQLFGKATLTGGYWNDILHDTPQGGLGYVVEYDQGEECVAIVGVEGRGHAGVEISPPWPSPARGPAMLRFTLGGPGPVSLTIHGIRGERVRTLVTGDLPAGPHARWWDGLDDRGGRVSPGVYFVRLESAGARRTTRLVVLGR